jgi:pilus assembly protein CpaE
VSAVTVAIFTENDAQLPVLRARVEGTAIARVALSHDGYPAGPTDPLLRQIQDLNVEVVLVEIDASNPERGAATIELLHNSTSGLAIFALGAMNQPMAIVAVMRAGACEYLDRDGSTSSLLEAFTRHSTKRQKLQRSSSSARVFSFINAKAGSGSTTLAVNTATLLQQVQGSVALVDFAQLGNAQLHLNARPNFGLIDALQNMHRLDAAMLENLMTPCAGGLHLLAGTQQPMQVAPTPAELARLFDLLVSNYRHVVVDCSSRLDIAVRLIADLSNRVLLVAQPDLVCFWSAKQMRPFLTDGAASEKISLILNRYKKIPGFSDEDMEKATASKIFWKIPNQHTAVAPAIEKGTPVVLQEGLDVSKAIRGMTAELARLQSSMDSVTKGPSPAKEGGLRRFFGSPIRAGSSS